MNCSDTLGCDSCEYDDPPPTPMEEVGLRLVQGDRSWHLDEADSGTAEDDQLGQVTGPSSFLAMPDRAQRS